MIHLPLQSSRPDAHLRAALALAAIARTPFRFSVEPTREGTSPLRGTTADFVEAFAAVFDADLEPFGADPSARVFSPALSDLDRRQFDFHIDSPGSSVELLGLMLPGLLSREYPTRLILEGCTHAPGALLPEQLHPSIALLVDELGGHLSVEIDAYGFPPRGGGRVVAEVTPVEGRFPEVRWGDRGYVRELTISIVLAHLQSHIGEREVRTFTDEMKTDVSWSATITELHAAASQGNVVAVEVHGSEHVETLAVLGEQGVRAETIGRECLSQFATYLAGRGRFHATTPVATLLATAAGGDELWTTGLDETTAAICRYAPQFLDTHIDIQDEDGPTTRLNIYRG